jgi:acetate kinase
MILVLNAGSSSLKYRLFDGARTVASGVIEHIGEPDSGLPDAATALHAVAADLDLASLSLRAIGHRVVHGGAASSNPP